MPSDATCCLCGQIRGDQASDFIAHLLPEAPYVRRVLLETESLAVVPDVAPLADGHVLLCPKSHVKSFGQLPAIAAAEYDRLKAQLRALLASTFGGGVHLFEHGMSAAGERVLCTVDHAHVHFVPLPERVRLTPLQERSWIEFDGSLASLARLTRGREYVMYESPDGARRVHLAAPGELESQYMRKVIAGALADGSSWNWRETPRAHSADRVWRRCLAAAPHIGAVARVF